MKTQPFPAERYRLAPKAELHVHLEGSVGPETLLALARGHGVTPPASTPAGINAWYSFRHFPDFLDRYFFVCRLLRRDADFRRIAHDYLLTAHRQGALHVEFHISASYHVAETRLRWEDILRGTVEGCEDAERECGISSLLIPDLSPHLGREKCVRVLDIILDPPHPRVGALGMGGPSDRWFVEDYASLMHRAKDAGLHVVSHAGEHGPAREIRHALVEFGAERIQHGIAAVNDPEVLQLVA
ncbi:hypothetical protein HZA57_04890, partial [Candidatus Poribacteria bacterium]|nr:hypothetical protein [Candidatus Poribacteria bacterium]